MKCRGNRICNICCYVCPKYNDCQMPYCTVNIQEDEKQNFTYQDCFFYLDINNIRIAKVEEENI